MERVVGSFGFWLGREGEVGVLVGKDFCWALTAPALRSSSRSWPLERRGVSLERKAQGMIGRKGRVDMNVFGQAGLV